MPIMLLVGENDVLHAQMRPRILTYNKKPQKDITNVKMRRKMTNAMSFCSKLINLICLSSVWMCFLNITNIAKECSVKRTTVASWVAILEELLIGYQIPIFEHRAKRQLSSHPKFYFFDAGVYRALRPRYAMDTVSELDDAALEGLVAQHLIAWKDYSSQQHTIAFWRTRSGLEVDFVVLGPLGFWAIEVKNSKTIHSADLRSLSAFKEDYPNARTLLLYRGKHRMLKKMYCACPVKSF